MPGCGGVEAGERVHKRGFAGAGRAHDGGEFAAFETHVHATQGVNHIAAGAVVLDQVDGLNSDAARCGRVLHVHNASPYWAGPYARMMIPTYEEIRQLSLESSNKRYDKQLLDVKFNSTDFDYFYDFYKERKNKYPTEKELGSIEFFNDEKYLYMGSFLFSDKCKNDNTKIVCTRYAGNSKGNNKVIDSKEYIGNLIGGYRSITPFIESYQKHGYVKLADRREDLTSFPQRAVFEAVINALARRDYLVDGSQINVDIFSNRLVITSPGSFYGSTNLNVKYDLENVVSKRRNDLICAIFIYLNAMEDKGTGFEKMTAEYKDADLTHKPYIYAKNVHFSIVLPGLLDGDGIPINYDSIIVNKKFKIKSKYDYNILSLCLNKSRSVKEIVYELGVSNSTYFRNIILENLVEEGLLLKEVQGKTTYYLTNKELVKLR